MVKLTIDNIAVKVPEGTTILEAARSIGLYIPTLCYLKDLNEIGACRVCVVELKGREKLIAACNTVAEEGMVIYTNSPKVRRDRRIVVELILSQHDCLCVTCNRSGDCELQKVAMELGILKMPFNKDVAEFDWPAKFPLVRDAGKCIKCMRCVQVCEKIQGMNIWDVEGTGTRTNVDVSRNRTIKESDCALCGQCITHCPTGALKEKNDIGKCMNALADPTKITVIQVAPAVRSAWAEYWGIDKKKATPGKMAAALRKLGFDYIFDTNFSADLTIMEEGSELLDRLAHKGVHKFPMFTSCCPGWVRFLKSQYPDMVHQLSTAKSPQQMFGAVAKSYFAEKIGADPKDIYCISVMPCIAKKHEAAIPAMNDACGDPDVDAVLTTREFVRMLRADYINPETLKEEKFDSPLGSGSGAAVIFGATGGVMEAALRSAYYLVNNENPDPDAFKEVRGKSGWREAEFELKGKKIRCAIVSGLGNTRKLMEAIRRGEAEYEFVEVMACPGGCAGGGGQPIHPGKECASERIDYLYELDKKNKVRFSHENEDVLKLYEDYLQKPLGEKSHHLLHTDHEAWEMPLGLKLENE